MADGVVSTAARLDLGRFRACHPDPLLTATRESYYRIRWGHVAAQVVAIVHGNGFNELPHLVWKGLLHPASCLTHP